MEMRPKDEVFNSRGSGMSSLLSLGGQGAALPKGKPPWTYVSGWATAVEDDGSGRSPGFFYWLGGEQIHFQRARNDMSRVT